MAFFVRQRKQILCPRTPSFSIRVLEKGLEGSACGISFKEKLSGRLSQSNGLDRRRETETKNCDARAGHTGPVANVGPKPHMDMFGKSFPLLIPPR